MDQPPAVAFTAFADVWPRVAKTEIGAALCAIGTGRTLTFDSQKYLTLSCSRTLTQQIQYNCKLQFMQTLLC